MWQRCTRCTDLATDGTVLFASCAVEGKVLKVDPLAGVTAEADLGNARTLAAGSDGLWVGFSGGLARLEPDDLSVVTTFPSLVTGLDGSIATGESGVWIRTSGTTILTRIDPVSNTPVYAIEVPERMSGGDLFVGVDRLWATAYDDNRILGIDLP